MQYMGSKSRLSKFIVPIIQKIIDDNNITNYLEPFVGGCGIIDKISCDNKYGLDIHEELIELLKQTQSNTAGFPKTISEDEYNSVRNNQQNYSKWYIGLVGFCGSFGAKYFGGYARGNDTRDRQNEAINNLVKQSPNLANIKFQCRDFQSINLSKINNYLIYCDIPYRDTTTYKTEKFPYDEFYKWAKLASQNNIVLISEYNMPYGFECIWEKEHKVLIDSNKDSGDKGNMRIEKLFICK